MEYRTLGLTGIEVSRLSFGAGPVAEVMLGEDQRKQVELVSHAIESGVNWFDTAAGYGDGTAELHLGETLHHLNAADKVHIATKARLMSGGLHDIVGSIERSVHASLDRLGISQVSLLQLHNAVTQQREDEPHSVTPDDVLGKKGVMRAFEKLRDEGLVKWFGVTGIGQPGPLTNVMGAGAFHTVQVPFNLVNPSAGRVVDVDFREADYGNIIETAARQRMGIFAIRVYAGGALIGNPPSRHTHRTKYFPLDLYERDRHRAMKLSELLQDSMTLQELALRFVLTQQNVTSAIIGFTEKWQIDQAIACLAAGKLEEDLLRRIDALLSE